MPSCRKEKYVSKVESSTLPFDRIIVYGAEAFISLSVPLSVCWCVSNVSFSCWCAPCAVCLHYITLYVSSPRV